MIDRPSLLETPNLANKSTFIESSVPGESVDDCYAWDSLIRGDYDGTDLAEWEDGKQIQETLPAAQWDAMIHDITALSYQLSQVCNSLWEEMYCIIHGAQVGMAQEAITQLLSGAQTFTNKTISFDSNTMTNVASLNTAQTLTNKTINFDDNTLQNVASLNTAQTLTNKTIDKKDNIVKCSATVISTTPYTLTPTKEMNCIIDVASGAITLGSGPYQGYELPILAKQDCTVSYIGAGGSTSDNLTSNQVTSYIWNGSAWIQNGVSIKPVFISTSGTVAPTSEANYVIDTASVTLTVQNGVYVGQKVWVTSNATGSQMWYTGINGSTLIGIQNGEIARMTWNGTYWFCEIIAIITGKDAQGNTFTYGGSVSIPVSPSLGPVTTVTTNGANINPSVSSRFVLNINTVGATCALMAGGSVYQKIELINVNANLCSVTYIAIDGSRIDLLENGTTMTYVWTGTYWISYKYMDNRPPIGIPFFWMADKPDWAIDFGNGASTKYLWSVYPELNNAQFKSILTKHYTAGSCQNYDAEGFYVPDLRGLSPVSYGTNGLESRKESGYYPSGGNTVGTYVQSGLLYHTHDKGTYRIYGGRLRFRDNVFALASDVAATGLFKTERDPGSYTYIGTQGNSQGWMFNFDTYHAGAAWTGYAGGNGAIGKSPTFAGMWIVRFE